MSDSTHPFPPTRWTLLQTLREGSESEVRKALETLCRAYWFPLYAVARKKGHSEPDAEDAVQGFFLSLLEKDLFSSADQRRGRLRGLLLTAFQNYCIREWRRQNAERRGGGVEHVDIISTSNAESRYVKHAFGNSGDVETTYKREWARSLLERSLEAVRVDHESRGLGDRFHALAAHLTQAGDDADLASKAEAMGLTYGAFRQALFRLRQQYRQAIESELALTLDTHDPRTIREEMLELFRAFE